MDSDSNQKLAPILEEIQFIWQNTKTSMRPWGVWICNYKPIECLNNEYKFNSKINRVWFLDRDRMKVKQKSEYLRFYYSQIVRPWCNSQTLNNPIFSDRKNTIGRTSFAKVQNSSGYYLEWQFAEHFGSGFSFEIDQLNRIVNRQLKYIS